MPGRLQKEFHRSEPFPSVQLEAFLSVVRTADHLLRGVDEFFKMYKLSITQFNVLRILHDGDGEGLPCKKIAERMVTRDPDITRLLDRLEARQLITRERGIKDRRVVSVHITPGGLELLKTLDQPVLDFHLRQLAHVPELSLTQLVDLLELLRERDPFPRAAENPCEGSARGGAKG